MPNFRHRLTLSQQKHYDRSNQIASIRLRVSPWLARAVELLEAELPEGNREHVRHLGQVICDEICAALRVPPVRLVVSEVRPSNRRGELHGLYTPGNSRRDRIEVWMVTAKRGQVVAFRTFLRTLLHELCHHLDRHFLDLEESFHTDGFFKRESSLFRQLSTTRTAAEK